MVPRAQACTTRRLVPCGMNPRFQGQFSVRRPLNNHHNGEIMASRIFALIIWAAVAASLAYWGLRWMARPTGVPANATPVSMDSTAHGELRRLLAGPAKTASGAAQADPTAASALAARLKLIGLVAPGAGSPGGVALLTIDGKPPRAVRIGGTVDGDLILKKLTQRSAEIGTADGPTVATLDLPLLPPPATGALPAPTGVTTTGGFGARAPTSGGQAPNGASPDMATPPEGAPQGMPPGQQPRSRGNRINGA